MTRPNLFDYATSELSQDAFLCWLLAWADARQAKKDPALHRAGRSLLKALLKKHSERFNEASTVDIQPQYYGADIVAVIDDKVALLIEDKIHAGLHGDQLARYRASLKEKLPHCTVLPTFLKTGDQSDYKDVNAAGYQLFLRQDLLEVLRAERHDGLKNEIFIDFLERLEKMEAEVSSYANQPISDWSDKAWKGFYKQLQLEFADLGWDYVNTPNGGFLGAWWHWGDWQGSKVYLQIERGPLCYKISVPDKSQASDMRGMWHEKIMESARDLAQSLPLQRPKHFGRGWVMTVAVVERAAWMAETPNGLLDMVGTIENLRVASQVLDAAQVSTKEPAFAHTRAMDTFGTSIRTSQ